jgi:hypothetical protein
VGEEKKQDQDVVRALAINAQSTSKDPLEACSGRLLKALIPALEKQVAKELQRDYGDKYQANSILVHAMAMSMGQVLSGLVRGTLQDVDDLTDSNVWGLVRAFGVTLYAAMGKPVPAVLQRTLDDG